MNDFPAFRQNESTLKRSARNAVCLAIFLALGICVKTPAQTLARPGWVGSGMASQSWFRHAVLYRINTRNFAYPAAAPETATGTLKGITEHLDYIHNLGIDAILLESLTPDLIGGVVPAAPLDKNLGTIEDFDELSLQASKRDLRILLTLPVPDPAVARYWLTRGVAGFYIPGPAATTALQPLRKLLAGFVGQRVLITDADRSAAGASGKSEVNDFELISAIVKLPVPPPSSYAAQLREALEPSQTLLRSGTSALLATDAAGVTSSVNRFTSPTGDADVAKLLAAVLLLNRSIPVVYAGQELGLGSSTGTAAMMPWGKAPSAQVEAEAAPVPVTPRPAQPSTPFVATERYVPYVPPVKAAAASKLVAPDPATVAGQELNQDSILSFYRQMIQLHHGRPAIREGDEALLNLDSANALAFVRRPMSGSQVTPPMVVVCNLSAQPLHLSLKADFNNLRLRGSFLRSVLHAGTESVSMSLDAISIKPYGVYVGELRY